jgi:putative transposase
MYKSSQDGLPDDFIRTRDPVGGGTVGVDLGETYLAAMTDGQRSLLLGGDKLRQLRAIREEEQEWFASRIDRKQKGSNRFWKLVNAKRRRLSELRNQIEDVMHKQTTRLVDEAWAWGVSTIVIGNITGIRNNMDFGADMNRRLHQWAFRQFAEKVEYKASRYGMTVEYVDEAYTSQTCPSCGTQKRSHKQGRRFTCSECDFEAHRDQVGARNIRQKYLAQNAQDSAPMGSGYLTADRATATGDATSRNDTPEDRQFDLFKRGGSEGRRMTPALEPPTRVDFHPHMTCVLQE